MTEMTLTLHVSHVLGFCLVHGHVQDSSGLFLETSPCFDVSLDPAASADFDEGNSFGVGIVFHGSRDNLYLWWVGDGLVAFQTTPFGASFRLHQQQLLRYRRSSVAYLLRFPLERFPKTMKNNDQQFVRIDFVNGEIAPTLRSSVFVLGFSGL